MGSEKFCLRWNDFENNISQAFKELRDDKDFFDVTLACDDEQIQAHKVILSACSPFFRNILRRNHHPHPLLYMKGVKYADLQSVLNFMYHGEVNVAQEELNSFLAVAEDLRVKGLTQNPPANLKPSSKQSSNYQHHQQSKASAQISKTPSREKARDPPPPAEQSHPPPTFHQEDDIQEVVPIKSEPRGDTAPQVPVTVQPQPEEALEQSVMTYQEEGGYEDYEDYQEQGYTEVDISMNHTGSMHGAEQVKGSLEDSSVKSPDDLYKFCVKEFGEAKWKCMICLQFRHGGRNQVRNHVESKHFPSVFEYHCKHCSKTCSTKKGLEVHISEKHRSAPST